MMGLPLKKIYGDSLVVINWENCKSDLSSIDLDHWCDNIRNMIMCSSGMDISHVYREHNQRADCLSKDALLLSPSHSVFSEYYDVTMCMSGSTQLF